MVISYKNGSMLPCALGLRQLVRKRANILLFLSVLVFFSLKFQSTPRNSFSFSFFNLNFITSQISSEVLVIHR